MEEAGGGHETFPRHSAILTGLWLADAELDGTQGDLCELPGGSVGLATHCPPLLAYPYYMDGGRRGALGSMLSGGGAASSRPSTHRSSRSNLSNKGRSSTVPVLVGLHKSVADGGADCSEAHVQLEVARPAPDSMMPPPLMFLGTSCPRLDTGGR
jgi:hypothetical protein